VLTTIAWIFLGILITAIVLVGGYVFWISRSLLSGWSGDPHEHLPEHDRAIKAAQHEYELADELGYPGEVLIGLDSKICAARKHAADEAALAAETAARAAEQADLSLKESQALPEPIPAGSLNLQLR
jgi:hypothetical protein